MKQKYLSKEDALFKESVCNIGGNKENERFSNVLEKLKKYDIIKSYKEFADNINETSVGLNDIKKGRKKLSINHVKNINIKYPYINTDFIIFEEGLPFHDDFLIKCISEISGVEFKSYEFDLDAIMNCENSTGEISIIADSKDISTDKYKEYDLLKELLSTKDELLKAKNKIIELQNEIYKLRLKQSK